MREDKERLVTLLPRREVVAWPPKEEHKRPARARQVPLVEALQTPYETHVHLTQYVSDIPARLNVDAIGKCKIQMTCVLVDVDGPNHEAPPAWRAEMVPKIAQLHREHPCVVYYSRGGLRLVWCLQSPVEITSHDLAAQWKRSYLQLLAYLYRHYGIEGDRGCAEWQRLFGVPRATRDPKNGPEDLPILPSDDFEEVPALRFCPDPSDISLAAVWNDRAKKRGNYERGTEAGGFLFTVLDNRGDVLTVRSDGTAYVRCPNREQHTTGRDGDSSTVLFPPGPNQELGHIHCSHAHCVGFELRDWLRLLNAGSPRIEVAA